MDRTNVVSLREIEKFNFDLCIDTCAYKPQDISILSNHLNTIKYCLISSSFVYEEGSLANIEFDPIKLRSPLSNISLYGINKRACEEVATSIFGPSLLIIRPSIIIGPGDHTGRMDFYLNLAINHNVIIKPIDLVPFQFIDVRDLANFICTLVNLDATGIFNAANRAIDLRQLNETISTCSQKILHVLSLSVEDLDKLKLLRLPYYEPHPIPIVNIDKSLDHGLKLSNLRDSLLEVINHGNLGKSSKNIYFDELNTITSYFT